VNNIHPPNKQDVGLRLALWALANTYEKKDVVYSGPLYASHAVEGNKIRVKFKHAQGLVAEGGKPLSHFEIAGEDQKFVPATAEIDGETIVASSPEVAKPVAVRFAWSDTAEPNLFNKAHLPASPFRTDSWPMVTAGKR
jgi:sialate O-acetylesterase